MQRIRRNRVREEKESIVCQNSIIYANAHDQQIWLNRIIEARVCECVFDFVPRSAYISSKRWTYGQCTTFESFACYILYKSACPPLLLSQGERYPFRVHNVLFTLTICSDGGDGWGDGQLFQWICTGVPELLHIAQFSGPCTLHWMLRFTTKVSFAFAANTIDIAVYMQDPLHFGQTEIWQQSWNHVEKVLSAYSINCLIRFWHLCIYVLYICSSNNMRSFRAD